MLIAGLMSGTSLDGIDVAVVEFEGDTVEELRWRLVHGATRPYAAEQRALLQHAITEGKADVLCALDAELGEWFAAAVRAACAQAEIPVEALSLIGSHGQTVWHQPPSDGRRGATMQLGDAATIAERTGRPVVSDFRTRDVAAGGQGAPLVPWVDQALFSLPERARALQNIGGIGNVTWVPARGSAEAPLAFDTGPGNVLIDAAVEISTGGRYTFDRDGRLAAQGEVDEALLAKLLAHPFFAGSPPKSTGRELFGRPFVQHLVEELEPEGDADWLSLIATLTELTARSIAEAYRRWLLPRGVAEVAVTGGGAHNLTLMRRLSELLAPLPVVAGDAVGIPSDLKEAMAFAVLAWAHLHGIPANVPAATGARGPRVLGSLTPGAQAGG